MSVDVLEEYVASIFRGEECAKLETSKKQAYRRIFSFDMYYNLEDLQIQLYMMHLKNI
jgi:hypothetical protein